MANRIFDSKLGIGVLVPGSIVTEPREARTKPARMREERSPRIRKWVGGRASASSDRRRARRMPISVSEFRMDPTKAPADCRSVPRTSHH